MTDVDPDRRMARYVGGPLHGETVRTNHPAGKWPAYRADSGVPIKASTGDREFSGRTNRGHEPRRFYTHQVDPDGYVYVHGTRWSMWKAERDDRIAAQRLTAKETS